MYTVNGSKRELLPIIGNGDHSLRSPLRKANDSARLRTRSIILAITRRFHHIQDPQMVFNGGASTCVVIRRGG